MGGQKTISRRSFFTGLKQKKTEKVFLPGEDDPLFDRYARKTLSPRVFHTTEIPAEFFRQGQIDNRVGNVTSGLTPYTGSWTTWEKLHLLRRTGYNLKKSDVDSLNGLSVSQAVDMIMTIDPAAPAPPVNWYNNVFADENNIPYGADWTTNFFPTGAVGQTTNSNRQEAVRRWLFGLSATSNVTIKEKMTWFWYHFIPIDFGDITQSSNAFINTNSARFLYQYFYRLRGAATGNFKTLIRNISTEPAMMFYLNNNKNTNTAPDENFARELMELFTIGKDETITYTQNDVLEAAKALTGWRVNGINTATANVSFDNSKHTQGNKTFSSFFNNQVIPNTGATELDALINMIFSKSEVVSKYICRRLYRFFIYYDIDANIEANVITPLAQTLVASNWEILPVLKQLFKSEHFFDIANRGVVIKSPFDIAIGTLRSFDLNLVVSNPTNFEAQYKVWNYFNSSICSPMDQKMGSIPTVSGWAAYYQTPAFHEYWINSNTIQKRFKFLNDFTNGITLTYNGLSTPVKADPIAFAQQFNNGDIQDPDLLVALCIQYLLPVNISAAQQLIIKNQTLLSGQTTNSYWTTAWNNYTGNPTNSSFKTIVTSRLKSLLVSILQLAEYQLM